MLSQSGLQIMNRATFFTQLWNQYVAVAPQAKHIHALFKDHSKEVINDHVAFRSFAIPGFDLDDAAACFEPLGYEVFDRYRFEDKHPNALAFWVPKDPIAPKIFSAHSDVECSRQNQKPSSITWLSP